ncbi:hypothetical protein E1B28_005697 [Marasmius oreades]|uniref:Bromodomain and PHD finger-containing protein 3 n=1 Tax=Marasmius oreades TaxID=181124 RepID=A0A9P7S418_9AGAR|nr:uncharacterized protein E1B28_005697 [Marasmius oreades]KAG7094890.1 hypothetical protein E1B28_005697 [Marasmius oreades]
MGRGRPSPVSQTPVAALPVVSFEKVEDDVTAPPSGVHEQQARSYGYNDFSEFQRPEYYIRHIEPLEIDLARQVEYDMDEQDKEWLDALNAERRKEQLDKISYETFEIVMDRLEKEWFDLTKNIPKPDFAMPSEDSTCAICDDSEGENANAIVFCDGCNLAVHQDCYGVPYIPEGQWLCRKCTVSPENPPSCVLCPNEGGAFKQTVTGEWCHLLCAIWIPETRVANDVFMEPVTGVDRISKQRWKLKCSICEIREGACIQCAKTSCFLAFHPTCARKEKLLLPMKSAQGGEPGTLTCYCERHLPKEQQDVRQNALAAEESSDKMEFTSKLSKSARAYAKSYKPGPPLIPAIIVDRISQYITKIVLRKKLDFLHLMCRYWSLKREARRGAPLLKRLHLEPWTATNGSQMQSEEQRAIKLDLLQRLRQNLEKAKSMVELTRKREIKKRQQAEVIQDVLSECLFTHEPPLRLAFEHILQMDRHDYFKNPVNKTEVPDYFEVVKDPMCWSTIDGKLDKHQYWHLDEFKDDINLVIDNALLYNKPGSSYYKTALRIKTAVQAHFTKLEGITFAHPQAAPDGAIVPDSDSGITPPSLPAIGNFEPPLDVLGLLESSEAMENDLSVLLTADPVTSLFRFELPSDKPPPPIPPPPPPPKARKGKKQIRAERDAYNLKRREQRAAAKATAAQSVADGRSSAAEGGIIMTRRAVAAEAEAISAASELAANDVSSSSSISMGLSRVSGSRRTPSSSLPVQPELLDDVDNKGSFRFFNAGWILPPDQRRGGRAPPTERPPLPPPRKRARAEPGAGDRATSSLSVYSTAEAENQTLHHDHIPFYTDSSTQGQPAPATEAATPWETGSSAVQAERPESEDQSQLELTGVLVAPDTMDVDISREPPVGPISTFGPPISTSTSASTSTLPGRVTRLPNGTLLVESLDTPAIRKQKYFQRKSERAKLQQASPAKTSNDQLSDETEKKNDGADAEIGLPSEVGSDTKRMASQEKRKPSKGKTRAGKASKSSTTEPGMIELNAGETLPGGTLVWAKSGTYPWWPAVIWEDDDPGVPGNIKVMKQAGQRKSKGKVVHVVQFFDKGHSWQALTLEKLRMLGEDKELDEDLLAASSRRQRWKNHSSRAECRDAYRKATFEMETDGGEGEEVGDDDEQGEGKALDGEYAGGAFLGGDTSEAVSQAVNG